ncbi:hypothetical protein [Mesorhizobium sp. M7A.F.Ca.US.010.02.1.1]|uniref:hypothetical protein n=1 Tax=unclassified Mesorhizobium TaxID=325217 RepID=UPI0032AF9810
MRLGSLFGTLRTKHAAPPVLQRLILLAAAGVKIREGKRVAAVRHATKAARLFRQVVMMPSRLFETALGMTPAALAECAEAAVPSRILPEPKPDQPEPVFDFILAPRLESV